ncbi:MAG TPA: hypothetical protein VGJ86_21225 [Acidimicrobiales bacterium]
MSDVGAATRPGSITLTSRVDFAELAIRPDGDEWIIGRIDSGQFVAVPELAHLAIALLTRGLSVDDVQAQLARQTGVEVDMVDLVTSLAEVGLLRSVDGCAVEQPPIPKATFGWLHADHVSWMLHPATTVAWASLCLAAAGCVAWSPELMPARGDLIWSSHKSFVVLGNAALAWTIIAAHELGHLLTARAAGVPGRISLSTRLQFLVAETDVSAVWASPRRTRLTVYLAGIAVNLALAAGAVLVLATNPGEPIRQVAAVVTLLTLLFIPSQLLVFMRTDLYFVIQDLARCRNLYADAVDHGRYQATRPWRWLRRTPPPTDPTLRLTSHERRVVRAYGVLMISGTVACLGVAITITLPVVASVLGSSLHTFIAGAPASQRLDAAAVLLVTGGVQVLWAHAWWRRHGHRLRRGMAKPLPPREVSHAAQHHING